MPNGNPEKEQKTPLDPLELYCQWMDMLLSRSGRLSYLLSFRPQPDSSDQEQKQKRDYDKLKENSVLINGNSYDYYNEINNFAGVGEILSEEEINDYMIYRQNVYLQEFARLFPNEDSEYEKELSKKGVETKRNACIERVKRRAQDMAGKIEKKIEEEKAKQEKDAKGLDEVIYMNDDLFNYVYSVPMMTKEQVDADSRKAAEIYQAGLIALADRSVYKKLDELSLQPDSLNYFMSEDVKNWVQKRFAERLENLQQLLDPSGSDYGNDTISHNWFCADASGHRSAKLGGPEKEKAAETEWQQKIKKEPNIVDAMKGELKRLRDRLAINSRATQNMKDMRSKLDDAIKEINKKGKECRPVDIANALKETVEAGKKYQVDKSNQEGGFSSTQLHRLKTINYIMALQKMGEQNPPINPGSERGQKKMLAVKTLMSLAISKDPKMLCKDSMIINDADTLSESNEFDNIISNISNNSNKKEKTKKRVETIQELRKMKSLSFYRQHKSEFEGIVEAALPEKYSKSQVKQSEQEKISEKQGNKVLKPDEKLLKSRNVPGI